jgi:hypothetical protein
MHRGCPFQNRGLISGVSSCKLELKPIVHRLRKYSHNAGYEYELAGKVRDIIIKNDITVTKNIVFPGCGAGAYEIALLDCLHKDKLHQRFHKVIMCDREILDNDVALWREYKDAHIVVKYSLGALCYYLQDMDEFNVIFFHKSKAFREDPHYNRFIKLCSAKCANPYINAYHRDGELKVFSCNWDRLLLP